MPLLKKFKTRKENHMKKVGFIGVYDKIDLILCIAKLLEQAQKKALKFSQWFQI